MSHLCKIQSISSQWKGWVLLHKTHQVSRLPTSVSRERDRADYKGASLGHARDGYHYFIHFLLTTKVLSSISMQRRLRNIDPVWQLFPTDSTAQWKRSKNDGRQLAFSATLLNRPLENKPLCQRQMVKLLKKPRAVPEYGSNNPRRSGVFYSPSTHISNITQSHKLSTGRSFGVLLDLSPQFISQENAAGPEKGWDLVKVTSIPVAVPGQTPCLLIPALTNSGSLFTKRLRIGFLLCLL